MAVVVATHNRASLVPRLIDALAAQRGVAAFEIVVVDDGSRDGTWAAIAEAARTSAVPVRPIRLDRRSGAAAARNAGWRATAADHIAFTDDDCVPAPSWLATMVAGLGDHDLVQGRTLPDPAQGDRSGPFSRTIEVSAETGYYETCNMAYRRSALDAVGGFDESFRHPYGEDCDLAWRVKDGGGRSAFLPDAIVHHDIWPSDFRAHLRDRARREGVVMMLKKHPNLRDQRGMFNEPTHPSAILALVAGVLFLMRPRPARLVPATILGLVYARTCVYYRHKPARRSQWLAVVPLSFVSDIYEIFVLARASARHRTLVL